MREVPVSVSRRGGAFRRMNSRVSPLIAGWRTGLSRPVLILQAGNALNYFGYGLQKRSSSLPKFPAIAHVALTVSDLDRSRTWYQRLSVQMRIPVNPYSRSGVFVHGCRRPRSGRR